jgi:hypothetical protein
MLCTWIRLQVGSVPTSTLTFKTFDAIAPTNSYLGAFRGYQTASAIRQVGACIQKCGSSVKHPAVGCRS